jgi:hypothetical protein
VLFDFGSFDYWGFSGLSSACTEDLLAWVSNLRGIRLDLLLALLRFLGTSIELFAEPDTFLVGSLLFDLQLLRLVSFNVSWHPIPLVFSLPSLCIFCCGH